MATHDLIYAIPPELVGRGGALIIILQAIGGVIIFYIVFNIINTIINRKRNKKLDEALIVLYDIRSILSQGGKKKVVTFLILELTFLFLFVFVFLFF